MAFNVKKLRYLRAGNKNQGNATPVYGIGIGGLRLHSLLLYVSNFNDEGGLIKKPNTLRNECISKLVPEGKLEELRWIDHLHNPTGMTIFERQTVHC